MDSWNKFNEPAPLVEDHYYSKLNQKGITKEDLKHVKKVCDTFKIKNLGEYHDLYVHSDTLLLAGVFENFRDKYIENYELDPAHSLFICSRVSMFKKDWCKIRIINRS